MTTTPTDHPTGLESGPIDVEPLNPDEVAEAEAWRQAQITQLREAFLDVAEKIDAAEVALGEVDDAIESFDLIAKDVAPREPDMEETWTHHGRADLDLPIETMNVLHGFAHAGGNADKPLRRERAALVLYIDALHRHQHHLMHVGERYDLGPEDVFPQAEREPAPDVAVPAPADA